MIESDTDGNVLNGADEPPGECELCHGKFTPIHIIEIVKTWMIDVATIPSDAEVLEKVIEETERGPCVEK